MLTSNLVSLTSSIIQNTIPSANLSTITLEDHVNTSVPKTGTAVKVKCVVQQNAGVYVPLEEFTDIIHIGRVYMDMDSLGLLSVLNIGL